MSRRFFAWLSWSALLTLGALGSSCINYSETKPGRTEQQPASQYQGEQQTTHAAQDTSKIEVLMINGGGNRSINYQSHLLHLKQMNKLLLDSGIPADRITIMTADGSDPAADLAVREEQTEPDAWLLDGTVLEGFARPRMNFENSKIDGVKLLPATREGVRRWFEEAGGRLRPHDTLLLYVTDHGTKNSDNTRNNRITLWGKDEHLDVTELRTMLALLSPGVRVVQLMSQCYSGSFANLMYRQPNDLLPSGDVCGFFSSTAERPAYGCYPENRNKENIGHSFRFMEALAAGNDFVGVHNRVLVGDDTPDVPLKTSDIYLESLLKELSSRRGQSLDDTIDELLREAWRDAAKWEPEIRLLDRISEAFGYFSPRLLSELELNSEALDKVSLAFEHYSNQWKMAYQALTSENLSSFLAGNASWNESGRRESIAGLGPEAQNRLVRNLIIALRSYTQEQTKVSSRLELLKERSRQTGEARYRMEVRQAVVLRLRTLLMSIAGQVYVQKYASAAQRKAYEALSGCESFTPVKVKKPVATDSVRESFPTYEQELELGKAILPGWMGIQYAQAGKEARDRFQLGSGAVVVSSVVPGSPALEAGLKTGDIVVGLPGETFIGRDRIREWVMTAPVGVPQALSVQRGNQRLQVNLIPMPEPGRWIDSPGPIKVGDLAPSLGSLRPYQGSMPSGDGAYLLFFFATWCAPCKASLPALEAFEQQRGMPVIAITDEAPQKLDTFFEKQKGFFPKRVMVDEPRQSFLAFGVNGTPTFVLVDHGRIKSIKVGFRTDQGLRLD